MGRVLCGWRQTELSNDGGEAKGCARNVYNYNDYIKTHNVLSAMKLLFPYDQCRILASSIHTCVCQSFPEDSSELQTSFFGYGIHYTYWKLNCAYLRCDSVSMSQKLNIAKRVMLSQTKKPSLSRPISRSKQATEMKQKATNS